MSALPPWTHAVALIVAILAVAAVWTWFDARRTETPAERARRAADTPKAARPARRRD